MLDDKTLFEKTLCSALFAQKRKNEPSIRRKKKNVLGGWVECSSSCLRVSSHDVWVSKYISLKHLTLAAIGAGSM